MEATPHHRSTRKPNRIQPAHHRVRKITRGNRDHVVLITIERQQLDAFIRYMCSLHDSKLSRIILARVGLACLVMRDETALKAPPETVIKQEQERTGGSRAGVIKTVGNLEIPR
jgi:hypothetical protein